jgi:hypothetical protein
MVMAFEERQKFRQWWILGVVIGIALIPVYGLYSQVILEEPFGNNPMSNAGLIIFLVLSVCLLVLIWKIELVTKINQRRVYIQFYPFVKKEILWDDVQKAEVVDYGFVGGWGIRTSTKYGTVYNTSGTMGLALTLKNGVKLCIGTQKAEEIWAVIQRLKTP